MAAPALRTRLDAAHRATLDPKLLRALPPSLAADVSGLTLVGEGRSGLVLRGSSRRLGREVAVKLAARDLGSGDRKAHRCRHEAAIAARLGHPNVLPLLDAGSDDGYVWHVTPFMPGGTLHALLAGRDPLPLDRVQEIVRQIAAGLDHAHARGVVHGALHPGKVLLDAAGQCVVADWTHASAGAAGHVSMPGPHPAYAAPEQLPHSAPARGTTDQHALALITYELLTGERRVSNLSAALTLVDLPELSNKRRLRAGLRAEVNEVIHRGLLREPEWRFPSAGDFSDALTAAVQELPEAASATISHVGALAGTQRGLVQHVRTGMLAVAVAVGAGLLLLHPAHVRQSGTSPDGAGDGRKGSAVGGASSNRRALVMPPLPSAATLVAAGRAIGTTALPAPRVPPASTGAATTLPTPPRFAPHSPSAIAPASAVPVVSAGAPTVRGGAGVAPVASQVILPSAGAPPQSAPGIVIVAGAGVSGTVFLDGVGLGAAPVVTRIAAGRHTLRVRPIGRPVSPAETTVVVGARDTTTVVFRPYASAAPAAAPGLFARLRTLIARPSAPAGRLP